LGLQGYYKEASQYDYDLSQCSPPLFSAFVGLDIAANYFSPIWIAFQRRSRLALAAIIDLLFAQIHRALNVHS
jgi:hypothetical protein